MDLCVTFGYESFITVLALELLITSMDSQMHVQATLIFEQLLADVTLKLVVRLGATRVNQLLVVGYKLLILSLKLFILFLLEGLGLDLAKFFYVSNCLRLNILAKGRYLFIIIKLKAIWILKFI